MEETKITRDIIRVTIGRDHTFNCDTVVIGRTGEHIISRFEIDLPEELCNMWPYLDFKKPNGEKVITKRLEIAGGKIGYDIPNGLLDKNGTLEAQLLLKTENGETWKSASKKFVVLESIDASDAVPEKEDFITDAQNLLDELTEAKENGEFNGKDGKDGIDGVVDYSLVANALKGSATGNPIAFSDVSPFPHEISVHVDVNGATVQKYGLNLFDQEAFYNSQGYKKQADGSWLANNYHGSVFTPTAKGQMFFRGTVKSTNVHTSPPFMLQVKYTSGSDKTIYSLPTEQTEWVTFNGYTDATREISSIRISFGGSAWSKGTYYIKDFIMSYADAPYEPYTGEQETLTADENGTLSILGNGESMTLIAEDGVTISAEYNADTKKYIDRRFAELATALATAQTEV